MQLIDLPKKMNVKTKKMTVVVSGRGHNFKMNVRPRWASTDGVTKSIGAEILNPPWGRTEFIMAFEPKNQDDVWGSVRV